MVSAITTSAIITELVPNPEEKEIIIETPDLVRGGTDEIQITLSDYDIAPEGVISVKGFAMSSTYGIVTQNEPTTSIHSGILTISSVTTATTSSKKIYRVVGTSL